MLAALRGTVKGSRDRNANITVFFHILHRLPLCWVSLTHLNTPYSFYRRFYSLSSNTIGESGAAALAAALRENISLTKLKWVWCRHS